MTSTVIKTYPRLWSLEAGRAMVVTDLHGDWDAYQRYRDRFVALQAAGKADYFIFTGDLIHREDPKEPDKSLEIVLDVIALQATYGQQVIYLSGNHEMPHLYGITLSKGRRTYTPAFEAAMNISQRRAEVIALFDSLPFFVRTRSGVTLTHAGASAPMANSKKALEFFDWSHQSVLDWADEIMTDDDVEILRQSYARVYGGAYQALAKYYLHVSDPADPRYNDLLRGYLASNHPSFDKLLWPALFTRCEEEYGLTDYAIFLDAMLQELSVDFYPQHLLVAGHMTISGGHQVIARQHLRLASAHHATPREAGQYLLFDVAKPIHKMSHLTKGLASVYK